MFIKRELFNFITLSTKRKIKTMKYKRVLLKLSGEALMGSKNFGIDEN